MCDEMDRGLLMVISLIFSTHKNKPHNVDGMASLMILDNNTKKTAVLHMNEGVVRFEEYESFIKEYIILRRVETVRSNFKPNSSFIKSIFNCIGKRYSLWTKLRLYLRKKLKWYFPFAKGELFFSELISMGISYWVVNYDLHGPRELYKCYNHYYHQMTKYKGGLK